jgi:hypothetical protein
MRVARSARRQNGILLDLRKIPFCREGGGAPRVSRGGVSLQLCLSQILSLELCTTRTTRGAALQDHDHNPFLITTPFCRF